MKSDSDLLGSAGHLARGVWRHAEHLLEVGLPVPLGETPSSATGTVALPSQPEPDTVHASLDAFALSV